MQGAQHAERQVVVAAQDGGDRRVPGQLQPGVVAGCRVPSLPARFGRCDARLAQRLPPPRRSGGGAAHVRGRGGDRHVVDGGMPQAEQVGGRLLGGDVVVHPDRGAARDAAAEGVLGRRRAQHACRDPVQRRDADPVVADHQQSPAAVDGGGHRAVYAALGVRVEHADPHREPRCPRRLLHALQGRRIAVEGGVGRQHGHRANLAARQCHRGGTASEAEFGDRGVHAVPGLRLDARMIVDHPGDRLVGDPGNPRHIADAGSLALLAVGGGGSVGSCVTGHRHARIVNGHMNRRQESDIRDLPPRSTSELLAPACFLGDPQIRGGRVSANR